MTTTARPLQKVKYLQLTQLTPAHDAPQPAGEVDKPAAPPDEPRTGSCFPQLSRNARLMFWFTIVFYTCRGVWMTTLFSTYLFRTGGGSNKLVGVAFGAEAIAEVVAAPVSGWATDRFRRDKVLKLSAFIGLLGTGFAVVGFATESTIVCVVGLVCWGVFRGTSNPALQTIFADAVASGERSRTYAVLQALRNVASCVGPALNVLYFALSGTSGDWDMRTLRVVMLVGSTSMCIPSMILWAFNDDDSLERESEALGIPGSDTDSNHGSGTDVEAPPAPHTSEDAAPVMHHGVARIVRCCGLTLSLSSVRWLVPVSDLLLALGAGLTVRFLPIFFMEVYHVGPVLLNVMFGIGPAAVAVMLLVAQWASKIWGRALAAVVAKSLAVLALFGMVIPLPLFPTVIMFLFRMALMNAGSPLTKAILMDYVPKDKRGKFNAIESIGRVSWTGSAVIGGALIDAFSYRVCFAVTGVIYAVALAALVPLIWLVPQEKVSIGGKPKVPTVHVASETDSDYAASRK